MKAARWQCLWCAFKNAIRKGHPSPAISQEGLENPRDPPWLNSVTQTAESVSFTPMVKLCKTLYYRLHTVEHLIKELQIALAVQDFCCCNWILQSQFWPFSLCMLLRSFSALLPFCCFSPMEFLSSSVWFIRFALLHFPSVDLLQCFQTISWGSLVHCLMYLCFSSVGSSHEVENWLLSGFYDIRSHNDAHITNGIFWFSLLLFLNLPSLSP